MRPSAHVKGIRDGMRAQRFVGGMHLRLFFLGDGGRLFLAVLLSFGFIIESTFRFTGFFVSLVGGYRMYETFIVETFTAMMRENSLRAGTQLIFAIECRAKIADRPFQIV